MALETPMGSSAKADSRFATTQWSVILTAGASTASGSREALERLCRTYWYPLYTYLRRRGCDVQEAEDCTQGFFAALLQGHALEHANPQQGRFRSFLLTCLNHFLADQRDRAQAQKRGGGKTIVSLDVADAETRYRVEPVHGVTPEKLFEKAWALTVLNNAMTRLKAEFTEAGKQDLFESLKPYLPTGRGPASCQEVAARLGMTEGAVKVAVHRLRDRYRQIVRAQVAQTVATPEQVEEEIRDLFAALAD